MNDIGTVVSVLFPVLTIIVSGACVLLFATTTTLRATNGDQEARIKFLEGEQERDKKLIADDESEITALQKVVTGEAQLQAIASQLATITDALEHILSIVEERAK